MMELFWNCSGTALEESVWTLEVLEHLRTPENQPLAASAKGMEQPTLDGLDGFVRLNLLKLSGRSGLTENAIVGGVEAA